MWPAYCCRLCQHTILCKFPLLFLDPELCQAHKKQVLIFCAHGNLVQTQLSPLKHSSIPSMDIRLQKPSKGQKEEGEKRGAPGEGGRAHGRWHLLPQHLCSISGAFLRPCPDLGHCELLLLGDTTLVGLVTSTVKWKPITASIIDTGTINFWLTSLFLCQICS